MPSVSPERSILMKADEKNSGRIHPSALRGRGLPSREDSAGVGLSGPDREESSAMSRRSVLKFMAASAVLSTGFLGCTRKPPRKIVSMADQPEYSRPGIPLYYASTWTEGSVPYGIMVKTLDGRPVKVEGLPGFPLNRGATNAAMQASLLGLYDPTRLKGPKKGKASISWEKADAALVEAIRNARSTVLITRSNLGPSERAMVERFCRAAGNARHFVHETVHDGPRRSAWKKIYGPASGKGEGGELTPDLSKARVVVSLDADFLGTDGPFLEAIRHFATTRRPDPKNPDAAPLSRLYAAESDMTVTGSNADHRIPLRPSLILPLVQAIRAALEGRKGELEALAKKEDYDIEVLQALVKDLDSHRGASVVLAGPHLPESVHAAVCLLNHAIKAPGATLRWNPAPPALEVTDPSEIAAALNAGVDNLILLGVNPVHDWPGGGFEKLLARSPFSVGHGLLADETVSTCTISLPSSHNLESWNDAAPWSAFRSLCQPVIAPLHDTRQEAESLLRWTRLLEPEDGSLKECRDWHDFLRSEWKGILANEGDDFIRAWEANLRHGFAGAFYTYPFPEPNRERAEALAGASSARPGGLEAVIKPHHALHDGRFASNGWLHELPDPVSRLVWDNAAAVGPATARELGVEEGDLVTLSSGKRKIMIPVLVQPGVAPRTVVVTLGHGRTRAGRLGSKVGVNTAALLGDGGAGGTAWLLPDVKIARTGRTHRLVRTQTAFSMDDRPIVLHGTTQEFAGNRDFVKDRRHVPEKIQLHDEFDYSEGRKWAMAIDLGACVGCGACITACQAENNIPIVGKDECGLGREMHWMRIDRYHEGDEENPEVLQQPMLCQHCDNAPCENVCPVNATAHSDDGLNDQIYNRCVGTRYCANNCPYKVRRFNFYNYRKEEEGSPTLELAHNPQVTVRMRGVMEKCSFCVQRINEADFRTKRPGRHIPDGTVRPACQQACPAGAIVFGDVNDPKSRVAKLEKSPLAYLVLDELNVKPNVRYLARLRNPHPDLEHRFRKKTGHEDHDGRGEGGHR